MKYPVTKKAHELLTSAKIPLKVLEKREPLNGKNFTVNDIQSIIDDHEAKRLDELSNIDEVSEKYAKIEKKTVAPVDPSPVVGVEMEKKAPEPEVIAPAANDLSVEVEEFTSSRLEIFWDERDRANALVRSGEYTITEVRSVPNAPYGKHKLLILVRN